MRFSNNSKFRHFGKMTMCRYVVLGDPNPMHTRYCTYSVCGCTRIVTRWPEGMNVWLFCNSMLHRIVPTKFPVEILTAEIFLSRACLTRIYKTCLYSTRTFGFLSFREIFTDFRKPWVRQYHVLSHFPPHHVRNRNWFTLQAMALILRSFVHVFTTFSSCKMHAWSELITL